MRSKIFMSKYPHGFSYRIHSPLTLTLIQTKNPFYTYPSARARADKTHNQPLSGFPRHTYRYIVRYRVAQRSVLTNSIKHTPSLAGIRKKLHGACGGPRTQGVSSGGRAVSISPHLLTGSTRHHSFSLSPRSWLIGWRWSPPHQPDLTIPITEPTWVHVYMYVWLLTRARVLAQNTKLRIGTDICLFRR